MKKSLIALAALGTIASSAMAQSSVTIYGIIDLGLVKQNRADPDAERSLGGVGQTNNQVNVAQGTKSRLGFKGVEDLGGGLSAKFELEHRFLPDTGAINTSGANQFWDKSIVGITSQTFGEVTLGRDYGPTFYAQYLLDPWLNQGIAEVGGTTYAFAGYSLGNHQVRYNNAIFYKAQVGGFTGFASAQLSEASGVKNRYGIGAMYTAGPLFVTGAYDQAPSPVNGQKDDLFLIGAAYDFGMIKPRISYARSSLMTPFGGKVNPTALTLAATVPVGTDLIKLGYTHLDWKTGGPYAQAAAAGTAAAAIAAGDFATAGAAAAAGTAAANGETFKQTKLSIGYEHVLSKRTALYTDLTNGKTRGFQSVTGFDVGIRHAF